MLDDVSKRIIEQLQEDGRRPYGAIGKAVGLSEAAVRQRVQRLTQSGWTLLGSAPPSIGNAITVSLMGGRSPPEPLVTTK